MCELAGASLVRGQAVGGGPHHKLGPSTCGHSAIQLPCCTFVVKTATDLLASLVSTALLVAGIPCCGSWALARGGAGSLHCQARKGLRVTHQTRMSSFSTSHWKVVDLF